MRAAVPTSGAGRAAEMGATSAGSSRSVVAVTPGTAPPIEPRALGGDLRLRAATDADIDEIVELSVEAHGAPDAAAVRPLLAGDAGPEHWTVVTDGDRVVSTCVLLRRTLTLDGVELPVGQPEYVATRPTHQRRGLIRAQFEEHHRRSEAAGDLLQLVIGIPHFYRRLGYEYALEHPATHVIGHEPPVVPEGWSVDDATPEDLPELRRLHEAAQAASQVRLRRTEADWRLLLDHHHEWDEQIIVVRDGDQLRGWGRLQTYEGGDEVYLGDVGVDSVQAGSAVLAGAIARTAPFALAVMDRPGTPFEATVAAHGVRNADGHALFVRAPDPVALLDRLRPALGARLAASPFGQEQGALDLSMYASGIRLTYQDGEVSAVEGLEGLEDPLDEGEVGVAPDAVATLVCGRFGASGLAARADDVGLGRHRPLMDVLFPRLRADVVDPI